jgi:ribosome maturation factor RimP
VKADARLESLIDGELGTLGFELVKLEISIRGRRRILRLFIDHPERGVTLDDCVRVTKAIGFAIDGEGIIPGLYNLEVSSPGINRPLTKPAHFKRFAGRTARIEHTGGAAGRETVIGVIAGADDEAVTVDSDAGTRRIAFKDIIRGNLHGEQWEIPKGAWKKGRSRRG